MFTYKYALFLRCKATGECTNMIIDIDTDEGVDCLSIHSLISKLNKNTRIFPAQHTLISMIVTEVIEHTKLEEQDDATEHF